MRNKAIITNPAPGIDLDALDQSRSLEETEYKQQLKKLQLRLLRLQRGMHETSRSLVIVMEGPDAAGKGGAIRSIVEKLDPRLIRVYSIVKPTSEEYQFHYLRRFWLRLPSYGQTAIFDRSWYGRVLVERVEGFATDVQWHRAYAEINEFERSLAEDGAIIAKIFLQITKAEQLKRFKKRQSDPYKHWKISDEDWRNRRKWRQHNNAAQEMFGRTSSANAPWTVLPANYKWHARIESLKCIINALEGAGIKP